MTTHHLPAGFEPFLAAAERAAASRPEVDLDIAMELMAEAATMLHNGLVVDHLDEHDQSMVIERLAAALTDPDPSEALRRTADDVDAVAGLHDPEGGAGAYLAAASVLRI